MTGALGRGGPCLVVWPYTSYMLIKNMRDYRVDRYSFINQYGYQFLMNFSCFSMRIDRELYKLYLFYSSEVISVHPGLR